jgi:transposase
VVVSHLPLIRHAIDELGIREVVDRLLPPDGRMDVSDGDCVTVMVLNILCGRVALYDMQERLGGTDLAVLLWEGCQAASFHDDRLGLTLDHLFHCGTDFVFSEVAQGVLQRPEIGTEYPAHLDTTSVSLEGVYEEDPRRPWPEGAPRPKRGYSKDLRPDLKQLIYGLTVHGPTRIPLNFSVLDGNTADPKANRFQIESLAALLPAEHEVTLVADCKFVDAETLGQARASGFHYVSLLPHTFGLRHALVEKVRVAGKALPEVVRRKGRLLADPDRIYGATSFQEKLTVRDAASGTLVGTDHRCVVVRSSTAEQEFDETIVRRVGKEGDAIQVALQKLGKRTFACEKDLCAEVERAKEKAAFHDITYGVEAIDAPVKRAKAGRPRKTDEAPPTERVWRLATADIDESVERIDVARFHAAHFVLVSDHLDAALWGDHRIVETYRAQENIEGHAGFRWLKDVAAVAPVFLKLPHRIQALALIFLFALMVRNWIEAHVRRELEKRDQMLPNFNDRPTKRPTAENVFRLFRFVSLVLAEEGGAVVERALHYLDEPARKALELFGLGEALFVTPREKSWRVPGEKSGM